MILLDSDHVSVLVDRRDRRHPLLAERLLSAAEPISIPVVVLEEHLRGWLASIRRAKSPRALVTPYEQLARLLSFFGEWEISNWTEDAADWFTNLRAKRIRIGTLDLRIAAIAMAHDATLLSANLRDFEQVPGLRVEDWLQA